jgi:heterodisulfide reductase subunit B
MINKRYNGGVNLPVIYFTQLLGAALGIADSTLGLHRLFVPFNPEKLMEKGGQLVSA